MIESRGNNSSKTNFWQIAGMIVYFSIYGLIGTGCSDDCNDGPDVPAITFEKTFGENSSGYCVQQTTDGGYIISGTASWLFGTYDYVLKTDENGEFTWSNESDDYSQHFGKAIIHQLERKQSAAEDSYAKGLSVQQTTDGGYIVTGYNQESKYYISWLTLKKYDRNGVLKWSNEYGWYYEGRSVEQTADGGYIVLGTTSTEMYLMKTDAQGNELWSRFFPGRGYATGFSIHITSDNHFFCVGSTWSSNLITRMYLVKTDHDGNMIWSQEIAGDRKINGSCGQQTADGGYIVTGSIQTFNNQFYGSNVLLLKTDAQGNEEWRKTFGGDYCDKGYYVQQTEEGGYIIVGSTDSFGAGRSDVYLIKTDGNGNELWSKTYGGPYEDIGSCVRQTTDGGFIIVGRKASSLYLIKTDQQGNTQQVQIK